MMYSPICIIHLLGCNIHWHFCFLQVFWKCYEYGDDLIQIFEFIDDQRAKSVRGSVNDAIKLDGDNLKDFPFRCDHWGH